MNPVLKFLYNPMVMMSVFLHGLFFMMPLPAEPPAALEKKAETPEKAEEVKLASTSSLKLAPKPAARLATPAKSLAKPLLVRPLVRPAVSAARPQAAPVRPPAIAPAPVAAAPVAPVAAAPVAPVAAAPVAPAIPIAPSQLQRSAAEGEGQASAADFYSFFPDPAAFFTAESIQQADANLTDPVQLDGVTDMQRYSLKNMAQVRDEELPKRYPGASFIPAGTYGGGDVYKVQQANSVGYVVLVKENSMSIATMLVEWDHDPNSPQSAASAAQ